MEEPKIAPKFSSPAPGGLERAKMVVPICITDMIMSNFIPFATFFMITGIPAKLAMHTKNTTITNASNPSCVRE